MTGSSFTWIDYSVWAVSLALSLLTGIISAWRKRKEQSLEEYVLAGRNMNPVAVALSLMASVMNANTFIAGPVEIYMFGAIFTLTIVGIFISVFLTCIFYLPVLHRMKLTSAYQYMEERFHSRALRTISSALFSICALLQAGVILYIPALAFNQVTGVQMYVSIVISGVLCLIYTMFGGMRAVLWVDALQMVVIIVGMAVFAALGIADVGGIGVVMERASSGGRLNFWTTDVDPRTRYTIWSVSIGYGVTALANSAANQVILQRYFAVKDVRTAQRTILAGQLLAVPVNILVGIMGLAMFAYYYNCDPITTGTVERPEQLVLSYMLHVAGHLRGMPGLYMAAIFAASISSLSSYINSLSVICLEDYVKPLYSKYNNSRLSEKESRKWCMTLTFLIGVLAMVAAFLPQLLGTLVIQLVRIFLAAFIGPILTLFTVGLLLPFANKVGGFTGLFSSMAVALWMALGSKFSRSVVPLPFQYTNCSFVFPPVNFTRPEVSNPGVFQPMYDVSYLWIGLYSLVIGTTCAAIASIASSGCRVMRVNVHHSLHYTFNRVEEITNDDDDKQTTSHLL